jgi:predicted RNase H-like HicB family nuclease
MELHATIHEDDDGMYWAEVKELPGCFASGRNLDELTEALLEAIGMCLPAEMVAKNKRRKAAPRARVDEMKLVTA